MLGCFKLSKRYALSVPLNHFNSRKYCNILNNETPRKDWKIDDVTKWAKNYVGDEAIKVLEVQEIDGDALLRISQEDLERWGMKGGPASKIIAALKPDTSLEHWQQLLKALDTITPKKVEWKGDPADDPNLLVLSLPNDLVWPTLESPHLFIRTRYDCYDRIWTAIEEAYLKRARHQGPYVEFARALIQGNSGIGKTAFLNYALYRAVKQGYPVLFETKKHRIFFQGDKVEFEDVQVIGALSKYQDIPNVLVLHDHKPRTEPPILTNGAFVIAPVSPDARNSDQFRRDKCLVFWMPLPTRQELEAMNSIELHLSFESLDERINLFGPVTRICLSASPKEYEQHKKLLTSRLQSFRYKDLTPILRATSLPTTQVHGLSWWIIHLDTTESLDDSIISWASPQILEQVTQITDKASLSELEGGVAEQLRARSPPLPTFEYQKWVTYKLAQGMDLPLRYFAADGSLEPSESTLNLSKSEVRRDYFYKISLEALKSQPAKLFSSSNPKAVLCDIATIAEDGTLILYQATIGLVHSLKLKYLKEFTDEVKNFEEVQRVRLIYVVPDVEVFRLQPKDLDSALEYINESGLDIKIAIAELKPHSARPNSLLDNRS